MEGGGESLKGGSGPSRLNVGGGVLQDSVDSNLAKFADPRGEVTGCEIVLHGAANAEVDEHEQDVVEFDIDEEEAKGEAKVLAMAHFFSGKKFNAHGLFEEMKVAWGLHSLKPVQVRDQIRLGIC
jgi:hypothetical protein